MIHVGIDLHTRNMTLAAVNDNGQLLTVEKLKSNSLELTCFFNKLERPVQATVESTSCWYWIDDWCRKHEIPLELAHAKMLKAIAYAKVKTDAVDAHTMAELLRVGLIPKAWKTDKRQRELRELTRGRLRLLYRRIKTQNSVSALAIRYNLPVKSVKWRNLMDLQRYMKQYLPTEAYFEARLSIEQIRILQDHIQQTESAIDRQIWYHESLERLLEIPGIGRVNGWTILAEIGDIKRFASSKQFESYCRLVPGSNDSAGKHRHKSANKDGNRYLKIAFNQAAISAYTHYKPVRSYFQKIRKRSGPNIARSVVAKNLARIVWHVLVKEQSYKGFKGQKTEVTQSSSYWPRPVSPSV